MRSRDPCIALYRPGSKVYRGDRAGTRADSELPPHEGAEYDACVMNTWLQEVAQTVQQEFSDLKDAQKVTRVVVRLLIAAALGGVLGFEREQKKKPAGLRTHMLVSVSAALFVLIPQQAGAAESDISRVVQGLAAGVGFLGAGTIIKGTSDDQVKGLTTAAGNWLTAAVGIAAGVGREATAIVSTLLALATLTTVGRLARHFGDKREDPEKPQSS